MVPKVTWYQVIGVCILTDDGTCFPVLVLLSILARDLRSRQYSQTLGLPFGSTRNGWGNG
jgi:hypothetical protein